MNSLEDIWKQANSFVKNKDKSDFLEYLPKLSRSKPWSMQACRKPVITNPVPTNQLFCSEFVTLGNTYQPPAALYINLLITS